MRINLLKARRMKMTYLKVRIQSKGFKVNIVKETEGDNDSSWIIENNLVGALKFKQEKNKTGFKLNMNKVKMGIQVEEEEDSWRGEGFSFRKNSSGKEIDFNNSAGSNGKSPKPKQIIKYNRDETEKAYNAKQ